MLLRKRHGNASARRIPLRLGIHDPNVRFSGRIDLMKTVYPRHDGFRASLTLSIVPEDPEAEEAMSVLSVVAPSLEEENTKKRRLSGLVDLVDMTVVMRRKFLKTRWFADQERSFDLPLQ